MQQAQVQGSGQNCGLAVEAQVCSTCWVLRCHVVLSGPPAEPHLYCNTANACGACCVVHAVCSYVIPSPPHPPP